MERPQAKLLWDWGEIRAMRRWGQAPVAVGTGLGVARPASLREQREDGGEERAAERRRGRRRRALLLADLLEEPDDATSLPGIGRAEHVGLPVEAKPALV